MSFGFSAGDFLAIAQLAKTTREQFRDAPSEFAVISGELQQLANITGSLDAFLPSQSLTNAQLSNLQTAKRECQDILNEMNSLTSKYSELESVPSGFRDRSRRVWKRFRWDPTEAQKLRSRLTSNISLLNAIYGKLSSSILLNLDQKFDKAEQDRLVNQLPYADGAPFNSYDRQHEPRCLTSTRTELLASVMEWADGAAPEGIFWLSGMAGTGKSTIARTVAEMLDSQGRLAGSFFFSKGRGDVGHARKLFSTLAVQMASKSLLIKHYLGTVIAERPSIVRQAALFEQYEKLLLEPLRLSQEVCPSLHPFVVVIDALDECGGDDDVHMIFRLLANTKNIEKLKLRIFLTSRREQMIRLDFCQMNQILHRDLVLHDIPRSIIERDITLFLKHELGLIQVRRHLAASWPGESRIETLVQKADCLFIFAATACRFLDGPPSISPEKRLRQLMENGNSSSLLTKNLDAMYLKVLQESIKGEYTGEEEAEARDHFRRIVGSIVVLFDILSISELGPFILGQVDDTIYTVMDILSPFHSILVLPEDLSNGNPELLRPVRLLHPSFRDFLLDKDRCPEDRFRVHEQAAHNQLAERCLAVMSELLRKDICGLSSPGILMSDIERDTVAKCVPHRLEYACLYWADHVHLGNFDLSDNGSVHEFLQEHFLHWLEVLSLTQRMSNSLSIISLLESLSICDAMKTLIRDCRRFVLSYRHILEKAPLQTYASAILFSPHNSPLRKAFSGEMTLEGHSSSVYTVVFSPNGQLVASGSDDNTVRLWDSTTGESRGTLEGHSRWVNTVVFSPNGQLVASGSNDDTVRLWDSTTGESRGTLEGHSSSVNTVGFSPNGQLVASGSGDNTVRLWDSTTGESQGTLEGHSSSVYTVVFSPNGQLVASGSNDNTVRMWDWKTCAELLCRTSSQFYRASFTSDSLWLLTGQESVDIRSWVSDIYPTAVLVKDSLSVNSTEDWITDAGKQILWLPPHYRPRIFAVHRSTVVLGNGSGRVTIIRLKRPPYLIS